jgi:hypothetical protein
LTIETFSILTKNLIDYIPSVWYYYFSLKTTDKAKNKEVTAPPVTSKKGRDIMLTLQAILIGLAIHITSKIVDVIVDAIN